MCFLTATYLILHRLQKKQHFSQRSALGQYLFCLLITQTFRGATSYLHHQRRIQYRQCSVVFSAGAQPLSHSPMATSSFFCRNHSLSQAGRKPRLDLFSSASAKLLCKGLSCQVLFKADQNAEPEAQGFQCVLVPNPVKLLHFLSLLYSPPADSL